MKAEIFDIQRSSFVDGPGIRTVIFFKGCNLRCKWCHNPESQSFAPELLFYADRCVHCGRCSDVCEHKDKCAACGKCAEVCPSGARKLCGRSVDTGELMKTILRDRSYYETSGGGATFSGGECLLQPEPLLELLSLCRDEGIQTAVDTAGNIDGALMMKTAGLTDLFLYDLKHMDPERHLSGTGARNELILSNLAALLECCPEKVIVRAPIIPGFNDDIRNIEALGDFLASHNRPKDVELLPYHRLGEAKYGALGRECSKYGIPEAEELEKLKKIITERESR